MSRAARFKTPFHRIYRLLDEAYGPQHWWPGETTFEVMVGAILTQNTVWANVERAIANLKQAQWLTPKAILEADREALARCLRPSGYFNVKAQRLARFCEWLTEHGGERRLRRWSTDKLRAALLGVKGIGPETADDILLYAFHRPVFVIDAYTRRIFGRLGLVDSQAGYDTLRHAFERALGPDERCFNQYHALIVHHAKVACRPRPQCAECVLGTVCKHREI